MNKKRHFSAGGNSLGALHEFYFSKLTDFTQNGLYFFLFSYETYFFIEYFIGITSSRIAGFTETNNE